VGSLIDPELKNKLNSVIEKLKIKPPEYYSGDKEQKK